MLLLPGGGTHTLAEPSAGEGWGKFGTERKTSLCQNVLLKNLTSSYSP